MAARATASAVLLLLAAVVSGGRLSTITYNRETLEEGGLLTSQTGSLTYPALPGEYVQPGTTPFDTKVVGNAPEQVKLTYWGTDSVLVSWATGDGVVGAQVTPPNPYSVSSMVQYATVPGSNPGTFAKAGNYSVSVMGTANNVAYIQVYNNASNGDLSYASPVLHHVLLRDLAPGTTYWYVVGDPVAGSWSKEYSFTMPRATWPIKIATFADCGTTPNASLVIQRVLANKPDIALLTGDISYADYFNSQGLPKSKSYPLIRSYQPRWDMFGRMLEQLAAYVPILPAIGNHELEPMSTSVMGAAFSARYPVPQDPWTINTRPNTGCIDYPSPQACQKLRSLDADANNVFYGVELQAGVAILTLSAYYPYEPGSKQYTWFTTAIAAINRTESPWLIVQFHTPMYLTFGGNFKSNECMRQIYEPLFYQYGVDFVFSGHSHAYERSHSVYNFEVNECGPVYFLVGMGGTDLTGSVVDLTTQSFCTTTPNNTAPWDTAADPQLYYPSGNFKQCVSFQNRTFCPTSQPEYSAYREAAFGSGLLTLVSATTATWGMYRTQDAPGVVTDPVTYTKNPSCANKQ